MNTIYPEFYDIRIKHQILEDPSPSKKIKPHLYPKYVFWRIFIDGTVKSLQKITRVEYLLPDTFPNNHIIAKDWFNSFEYTAYSFKSFYLKYTIYPEKSSLPISDYYYLDITRSNERGNELRFA